jgi:transposase
MQLLRWSCGFQYNIRQWMVGRHRLISQSLPHCTDRWFGYPWRGFVLLPTRWVVERRFGWEARFRCLAKDQELLPETVAGLHCLVFACLMLAKAAILMPSI